MMGKFRFGIMGVGSFAGQFCDAVSVLAECEVVAISGKSKERVRRFARQNGLQGVYDSYDEMLRNEQLDCIYIAVTAHAHYQLLMMCLHYGIPVLCEKPMFLNSEQAKDVFLLAARKRIFVMEAMWSRFLPAVKRAREWVKGGEIGKLTFGDAGYGFRALTNLKNRCFNTALRGGKFDDGWIMNAYELMIYMIEEEMRSMRVSDIWEETGVEVSDYIVLKYKHILASQNASFVAPMETRMILYGEKGKIVIFHPHYANEAFLYDKDDKLWEHYQDQRTMNGFVYEIREVMDCIRNDRIESSMVPHELTIRCIQMFDAILDTRYFSRKKDGSGSSFR